ncbi:unnamed protein product [Lactuca virosa]|uniref:Uncharacterized protein n=1 Tax=Lactuca virosa TaxID=75947 RepID=A0AAU9NKG6_9ASTR|nr:unnamed protein product [Lactuca virosa]
MTVIPPATYPTSLPSNRAQFKCTIYFSRERKQKAQLLLSTNQLNYHYTPVSYPTSPTRIPLPRVKTGKNQTFCFNSLQHFMSNA